MTLDARCLLLLIACSIYFFMFCQTYNVICKYLKKKEFIELEGLIAVKNVLNHELNKEDIQILSVIGAFIWPIYYLFAMGASFGCGIYETLLENKDENRLATWFF